MRYFWNRLGFLLISVWAALTLNFILPHMMPGNPAEIMFARYQGRLQPSALKAMELQFGVNHQPIIIQYIHYLGNMISGNWGLSITYYPISVLTIIQNSLPWTIGAVGIATLLSILIGTIVGIIIAWRRGGILDGTIPIVSMFLQAVPYNVSGFILLYFFGFMLGWFPMEHAYGDSTVPGLSTPFVGSVLYHGILPVATIFISAIGGWIVGMRNNMINTLGEDFVTFAEAKGVSNIRLIFSYTARNAILPQVTSLAIALGSIVSGSILMEVIFSYPGVGYQLNQAVSGEDYPLIQGMFLIIAISILVANFIIDMIYVRLDPRVRTGGATS